MATYHQDFKKVSFDNNKENNAQLSGDSQRKLVIKNLYSNARSRDPTFFTSSSLNSKMPEIPLPVKSDDLSGSSCSMQFYQTQNHHQSNLPYLNLSMINDEPPHLKPGTSSNTQITDLQKLLQDQINTLSDLIRAAQKQMDQNEQKILHRIDRLEVEQEGFRVDIKEVMRQSQVHQIIPPLKGDYSMHIMQERSTSVSSNYH